MIHAFICDIKVYLMKKKLNRSSCCLSILLAVVLFGSTLAVAQNSFGTIVGTVTDPSNALVPNATITITNTNTSTIKKIQSDASGSYTVPSLPPGIYVVKVEGVGFGAQQGNPITLQADQTARVDFALKLGGGEQIINVDTSAATLQIDSPTIGATVNSKQIEDLPLNDRNFVQLTQLIPGVNPGTVSSIAARRGRGSIGQSNANGGLTATQINGQRDVQNRFFIEGTEAMDYDANTYAFSPSIDAISQFKVDTSSSTAENGAALGGFINIIIKSGTNAFHGTLWEFNQNSFFTDTHDFISVTNPNPLPPRLNRNQFGGNIGGPVFIPHVYNGTDKTFFFLNEEEGRNLTSALPQFLQVPTLEEQGGNLNGLSGKVLAATGTTTVAAIIDPTTGQPFPNNQIPTNRIDARALTLLSFTPPNGTFASGANYQSAVAKALSTQRDIITRIDHTLRKNDQINGHYVYDATYAAGAPIFPNDEANNNAVANNLGVTEVHTFNANLLNTITYGYHHFSEVQTFGTTNNATYNLANQLNIPFASSDPRFYGPPVVTISGPDGIFKLFQLQTTIGPRNRSNSAHTIADSVSLVVGKHFLTLGTQLTFRNDTFDQIRDPHGTFSFNGQWTGSALVDFLLGYAQNTSINPTHTFTNIRDLLQAYFVQDTWRPTRNVTVNAGLRWDHLPPWVQNNNQYAAIATLPTGIAGGLLTPSTSPYGRGLLQPHYYDFGPRLGIAYQPFGEHVNTVFRAAYGIFYADDLANAYFTFAEGAQAQAGAQLSSTNQARIGVVRTPGLTLGNPFPNVTPGGSPTYPFANAIDPHLQDAYTQQYSVTFEQELGFKLLADIGYVGAKSTHNFSDYPDVNIPFPVNPLTPGLAPLASRRPDQAFLSGGQARLIRADLSVGSSTYNSLQAKLERRVSHGLSFIASYTWSHSISGPADEGGYVGGGSQNTAALNIFDHRADRSTSAFDLPQRFVGTMLYDLPFFSHMTGWKRAAFDGIQVSTIFVGQSGPAGFVSNNVDTTGTGLPSRPDILPGQIVNLGSGNRTNLHYFNTAAFAQAAPATFGNEPRTAGVRLPGIVNDDASLVKGFKFGESRNLQIRGDIFNVFLHYNPNPNAVGLAFNNPNSFGKLGGGTSDPVSRIFQLSAKLYF
jgi:hypothetical protein